MLSQTSFDDDPHSVQRILSDWTARKPELVFMILVSVDDHEPAPSRQPFVREVPPEISERFVPPVVDETIARLPVESA